MDKGDGPKIISVFLKLFNEWIISNKSTLFYRLPLSNVLRSGQDKYNDVLVRRDPKGNIIYKRKTRDKNGKPLP